MYTEERRHPRIRLLGFLLSLLLLFALKQTACAAVGLITMQLELEGTPGSTCTGQLLISNTSDTVERVRIRIVPPSAFHLLNRLPDELALAPCSELKLPLKFMISRSWTASETTVLVEAYRRKEAAAESSVQFIVHQREDTGRPLFKFSLVTENPYISISQDTLLLELRLQNLSFHARTVRLLMHSLPQGFHLTTSQNTTLTLTSRQDTTLKIPCLAQALRKEQSYQIAIELQDMRDNSMLGVVICRPVLLASTKRLSVPVLPNQNQGYGITIGYGSLGQGGAVQEISGWGHQYVGKGRLTFNAQFLTYTANGYREFRDTYLQYEQDSWQVRIGSLYDYHELLLNGTGIKAAYTIGQTHFEAWALRNTTNWLRPVVGQNYNQTYSLRVSGALPISTNLYYTLSSSYYTLQRSNRSGILHYGKLDWQLSARSRFKLTIGQSTEAGHTSAKLNQTHGWSIGTDFAYRSPAVDLGFHTYFSNPDYSGMQRGASLAEHNLIYKVIPNTLLSYRFSRIAYDQRFFTSEDTDTRRGFNSTTVELGAIRKFSQVSLIVRPYFWYQSLNQPTLIPHLIEPVLNYQQSQSYRVATSLRYTSEKGTYAELGADAGYYKSQAPISNLFQMPVFRLTATIGTGALSFFAAYQHGPYQINDQQPYWGNPLRLRQFIVSPSFQYTLFDKKIRGDAGFNTSYSTNANVWSGFLRHSLTYAINESLQIRTDVGVNSYANEINELGGLSWQNTQFRMSVSKTFSPMAKQATYNLSLRFYEDLNGNRQKDADEPWMEGLVVNVNNMALITTKRGAVVCKGMAPGLAIVKTQCRITSGETIMLTDSVYLVKSMVKDIAVRKTFTVTGQLICNLAKYGDKSCDLNAYVVEARNSLNEVFRTYADDNGRFKLFLPPGQFMIQVTNSFEPETPVANPVSFVVPPANLGEPAKLLINVGSTGRPIKVKRFSPSSTGQNKPESPK